MNLSFNSVRGLFPVGVLTSHIGRLFTEEELTFMTNVDNSITRKNISNKSSMDKYILESEELSDIKEFIEGKLQDYFDEVISAHGRAKPVLTQSWLNYTDKNQSHHSHRHQNSFISGVLYIKVSSGDSITLLGSNFGCLQLETISATDFNYSRHEESVSNGGIILFPSDLEHEVKESTEDSTRISLAFNSFVEGTLGGYDIATELKIKRG